MQYFHDIVEGIIRSDNSLAIFSANDFFHRKIEDN